MKNRDIELVRRTLDGDDTAFTELVRKYQKPVHALAWRKLGDFHIAEELTQDAFLKAYQKLATLKEPERFSGWLYVIAANLCSTWLRKKHLRTQPLEETNPAQLGKATYSGYVIEENERTAIETQREVVKKLLAKLQESERTIVMLRYFGEMSSAEIGEFLGISANTIRSRLRRAQQRLKEEEPMIREALINCQITPNLTENIMREISRMKPIVPSGGKPVMPWAIAASTVVVVLLMLGIGNQHLLRFQKPYSFDAVSEMTVELIEAPVVLNLESKPDIRTQLGISVASEKNDASEQQPNDTMALQNSQTWNLPENAIVRFGKGGVRGSDRAVAFSPDGKRLAVATGIGIWIYDGQTYHELSLLTGHTGAVLMVVFSADGKTLASLGADNTAKLWNLDTGDVITTLVEPYLRTNMNSVMSSVAFSPDGKRLASGSRDGVKLWNIENGQHLATFEGHELRNTEDGGKKLEYPYRVLSVAFSPDGKTVAAGVADQTIRVWDVETGENVATFPGHKEVVHSVAFSPDGKILVSGSGDDTVKLWHVLIGRNLQTFKHRKVSSVAFSPDGKVLASGSGSSHFGIKLWNVETGEDIGMFEGSATDRGGSIAFSPDGATLASAPVNRLDETPGAVRLWDVKTGKNRTTLPGHIAISQVSFPPDGKILVATTSLDGSFKLWDIKTGKNIHTYRAAYPRASTFARFSLSPDGKILASSRHGSITLLEVETRKIISTLTYAKLEPVIGGDYPWQRRHDNTCLAFSPDSQILALGIRKRVELWKYASESNTTFLGRHTDEVGSLAFSPDGKILASWSRTILGEIKLWNIETGQNSATLEDTVIQPSSVVFSPDGKTLAVGGRIGKVGLWDVSTEQNIATFEGHGTAVHALAFSPDGTTLAASGTTHAIAAGFRGIKLWDIETGENIATFGGHEAAVFSLSFSPDATTLTSVSRDGVLVWDLKLAVDR